MEKILKVNPKERISLENIYKHPWVSKHEHNEGKSKFNMGFIQYHCEKKKLQTFEEDILSKIEKYGFPREYLIRSMTKNNFAHVNALYALVLAKKNEK